MPIIEFSPQRHHGTKNFDRFFVPLCLEGKSVFLRPSEYATPGLAFRTLHSKKQRLGQWRVMDVRVRADNGRHTESTVASALAKTRCSVLLRATLLLEAETGVIDLVRLVQCAEIC